MNFLVNENFPLSSIKLLRQADHAVVAVIEDMPGAKDADVLQYAADNKCIILTFDRDYGELIYRHRKSVPAGVVYFRFDPVTPDEPYEIFLKIISDKNFVLEGKFTVVERDEIRQRKL